jgi:hypothetical protein
MAHLLHLGGVAVVATILAAGATIRAISKLISGDAARPQPAEPRAVLDSEGHEIPLSLQERDAVARALEGPESLPAPIPATGEPDAGNAKPS